MKNKLFSKKYLLILCLSLLFLGARASLAALVPDDGKKDLGNYELNDFLVLAVNLSQWILGIVGSLALLMFVYGGLTFVLSGGSAQAVDKGKKILIGAVIGLVIVFTSWTIIKFSMLALGLNWNGTSAVPTEISPGINPAQDAGCTAKASDGYSCVDNPSTTVYDCITGLCGGDATRKCCKAK